MQLLRICHVTSRRTAVPTRSWRRSVRLAASAACAISAFPGRGCCRDT
ncbi:hypothetical protein B4U80_11238 [Leptotrombidium deliense]|uniref:Uncharacterized protein n=1 Tax=Leptotrombidium deliense TaxID=299467 RepID=A0A443SPE1_9ACAR|nr:hypothetical protein B4U80_11238 [Leptotrombidium deliense]